MGADQNPDGTDQEVLKNSPPTLMEFEIRLLIMKKVSDVISITLVPLFSFGCNSIEPITESDVINALDNFFSAMDVDNFDRNRVTDLVTDDFRIYEMEKNFTLEQFFNFIDSQTKDITSTNWELSNHTVSIDDKSAHVHYLNKGSFLMIDPKGKEQTMNIEWLESAYFVKENGKLKLKFLQSDDITKENPTNSE